MTPPLVIARLTVREASRKKLLLALLIITATVISLTVWGFSRLPTITITDRFGIVQHIPDTEIKLITSQLLVIVMFCFSFVLALSAVFMAAPSIAGEIESGQALAVLTRPISRTQYLLGKWLGLGILTAVYVGVASAIEFALVRAVTGYSPPRPLEFVAYLSAETLVVLSFGMLISTRLPSIAGGVAGLGLFMLAWIGGIGYSVGVALDNSGVQTAGIISRLLFPTDGMWRGAIYSLEPASVIAGSAALGRGAASNPFIAMTGPPVAYLLWTAGWVVVVLALATWSFRNREV